MEITNDIIAAVSGPGWKYGLSRILINADNVGVVFIAGSEKPLTEFEVTSISTSRGTGVIEGADGGEVTWRRRGSSCQYKLAKCKINTATMTEMWEANREAGDPEAQVSVAKVADKSEVVEGEPEGGATGEPDASKGDVVEETPAEEPVEEPKPKRKRRTKAQIEADNAAAEKAKLEELL